MIDVYAGAVVAGHAPPMFRDDFERLAAMGGTLHIPLNGGSETRNNARAAFDEDLLRRMDFECEKSGSHIILRHAGNPKFLAHCKARYERQLAERKSP
jgi:hypothetical protein